VSAEIEIEALGDRRYAVTVRRGGAISRHEVTVPASLSNTLGVGPGDDERLVRGSFEFLLAREEPSSILERFDLDVISRYFPEYLATIGSVVRSA
jgi:hypothetical protein